MDIGDGGLFFKVLAGFLSHPLSVVSDFLFLGDLAIGEGFHKGVGRGNVADEGVHAVDVVLVEHGVDMRAGRGLAFLAGGEEGDDVTILCAVTEIVADGGF